MYGQTDGKTQMTLLVARRTEKNITPVINFHLFVIIMYVYIFIIILDKKNIFIPVIIKKVSCI
jgi:hypothetical protein